MAGGQEEFILRVPNHCLIRLRIIFVKTEVPEQLQARKELFVLFDPRSWKSLILEPDPLSLIPMLVP